MPQSASAPAKPSPRLASPAQRWLTTPDGPAGAHDMLLRYRVWVNKGGAMRLELTEEETATLRALLHDYLPDLRREVAATDAREMRHELFKRQDLCERLLARLGDRSEAEGWRAGG